MFDAVRLPACFGPVFDEAAAENDLPWRVWLWLAPFLLIAALVGSSPWGLWEPDEGRYANVAQEMIAHGDFITPRIDDVVFLDKPPLVYWVTAASIGVFGQNEFGARCGQIAFAAGLLAVVCGLGRLLYGARRAFIAVIVLGSSLGFFAAGHFLTLDLALAFFVALTLLCLLLAFRRPRGNGFYLAAAAAAAGGVLSKGPIALLLPGMTIVSWLALRREWRRLREVPWMGAAILFLALVLPWYVAVSIANPEFPRYFFLHENLARFATTVHHREGGWAYYLAVGAAAIMPWTPLLAVLPFRTRPRAKDLADRLRSEAPALLVSWIVPAFLFFQLSRSKLPGYLLPLLPAAALGLAALLDRALLGERRWRDVFLWPLLTPAVLLAGALAYWWRHQGEWNGAIAASQVWHLAAVVIGLAIAAQALGGLLARRGRALAGLAIAACLWSLGWFVSMAAIGRVGYINETSHLAAVLREEKWSAEPVYTYHCYLRGLPFYLRTGVDIVSYRSDELEIGRAHDEEQEIGRAHPADGTRFASEAELLAGLRGPGRVFAVLPRRSLEPLQEAAGRPLFVLARTARLELISNQLGSRREGELRSALGARHLDLNAFAEDSRRRVPGGLPGILEVKTRSGVPLVAVDLERDGTTYEVTYPIGHPADAVVTVDDDLREEDEGEPFILRLAPSRRVGLDLPIPPPGGAAHAGS